MRTAAGYVTRRSLGRKARSWMSELKNSHRPPLRPRPEKAGLLVVDMQGFFLDRGSPAYMPQARAILGNVLRLVRSFRQARRPVFFSLHAHQDPSRDGGLMTLWWKKICLAGTRGARVSPSLGPRSQEIFPKCRYSAFSNPSLSKALRSRHVEDLVVAGIMTDLCVESSVRAAFDKGFRTFVAADATAAHTEDFHLASLKNMAHGFSVILPVQDIRLGGS